MAHLVVSIHEITTEYKTLIATRNCFTHIGNSAAHHDNVIWLYTVLFLFALQFQT